MLDKHSWHAPHALETDWEWYLAEFGESKARAIMREMQYYNAHGRLPEDAWVIERIEWVNDAAIIVHQNHYALRQ